MRCCVFNVRDLAALGRQPPVSIGSITRAVVVLAAIAPAGCRFSAPPEFRLNFEGRDRQEITLVQIDALTETLQQLFGTPDHPAIPEDVPLNLELLEMAAGPIGRFEDRSGGQVQERGLYRQHCAACHGISGDGAGPLATVLYPYPRDFRNGTFKYTSTAGGAKPARDDLKRALLIGNTDTGMPSFRTLPDEQIEALVEYVEYLGIRGETELYLLQLVVDQDEYLPLDMEMVMDEGVLPVVDLWGAAEAMVVVPPSPPQADKQGVLNTSIKRGRELYLSENAKCAQCHGITGKGDGEQADELYDDWSKRKKGTTPKETESLARLFELPIQRLRPRDFTRGILRGGDRPVDVYWRICVGIKGTPMPAALPTLGARGAFSPEEIWHVVNYIRSLTGEAGED